MSLKPNPNRLRFPPVSCDSDPLDACVIPMIAGIPCAFYGVAWAWITAWNAARAWWTP